MCGGCRISPRSTAFSSCPWISRWSVRRPSPPCPRPSTAAWPIRVSRDCAAIRRSSRPSHPGYSGHDGQGGLKSLLENRTADQDVAVWDRGILLDADTPRILPRLPGGWIGWRSANRPKLWPWPARPCRKRGWRMAWPWPGWPGAGPGAEPPWLPARSGSPPQRRSPPRYRQRPAAARGAGRGTARRAGLEKLADIVAVHRDARHRSRDGSRKKRWSAWPISWSGGPYAFRCSGASPKSSSSTPRTGSLPGHPRPPRQRPGPAGPGGTGCGTKHRRNP